MATVDQKAVEKDWNARGFSCDLWIDAPGRVWRNFIHEADELVMLVEGEEEFEMNGQIHRLEIGQELLIFRRHLSYRAQRWQEHVEMVVRLQADVTPDLRESQSDPGKDRD
jgi:hypothetical protein